MIFAKNKIEINSEDFIERLCAKILVSWTDKHVTFIHDRDHWCKNYMNNMNIEK